MRPASAKPVTDADLVKFVKGLRIRKETDSDGVTKLRIIGLGHPSCLRHMKIELDRPVDDNTGNYAIRVTKRDLVASNGSVAKTEDDCTIEKTRQCSRDPESGCVAINEGATAAALGIAGIEETRLDQDGKITYRLDNWDLHPNDPNAVQFKDIPRSMGGPLEYKTPETISAEMQRRQEGERNQLIASTCKGAEQGNRGDLEQLKEMLGPEAIEKNGGFFKRLEKKVNQKEFADFRRARSR